LLTQLNEIIRDTRSLTKIARVYLFSLIILSSLLFFCWCSINDVNFAFRRWATCFHACDDDWDKRTLRVLIFIWINCKNMLRWRWWIFDDEINTFLTRFDSCAFAWLSYFQSWINCHEASNVFWKFETSTRRILCVYSSFDTRLRIIFICRAMFFWNFCSSSNCHSALCFRFQRKVSQIKRVCVLSTWCRLDDVFFLVFKSVCV
jgi:hypothetical protein